MAEEATKDYVRFFMETVIKEKKNLGTWDRHIKAVKKALGEKGFLLHKEGFEGWHENIKMLFTIRHDINSVDRITLDMQVKLLAHIVFDNRLGSEPEEMLEKIKGMEEKKILEGYQDIIEMRAGEVMEGRAVMRQYLPKFLLACFEVLKEKDAKYFVELRSALPYPK